MPNSPTSNMALVMPTENSDSGTWDTHINAAADLIDAHDHSSGKGVKVKTNGLDINADLTFTSAGTPYAVKDAKAVDFSPVAASTMAAYAGAFFVNSDDSNNLYFRTVAGSNVKVTNGAALNVGAFTGGFGGDYGSIPAEANFVDASKSYTFKSTAAGNWSRLQAGAMRISEFGTTEATYVELACPAALGGTYTMTFPTALPGSTSILSVSSAGVISASNTIANAVTFSAGATAAAGQHFTVSSTGDFKHGDRIKNISLFSGSGGMTATGTVGVVASAGSQNWHADLGLRVGDRIKSLQWFFDPDSTGAITFALKRRTIATGAAGADIASTSSTAGGGYQSVTQSSINYTLVTTEDCFLNITSGQNLDVFYTVIVTYDHP